MAHPEEPMDIDSDFDKENTYHHNNVLPCTEKGYEELDVSELNMKLRYSVTPACSPMSKSYTANCVDNRNNESGDNSLNVTINENTNLTRSLNLNFKNDNVVKSLKALPLQSISTEQFNENRSSVLQPIDPMVLVNDANVTVTISESNDIDENLSLPSSSSSNVHTPEATTPTKEMSKGDGGSPIMRGLKSVLNMFRSSQSPIPLSESDGLSKQDNLSPLEATKPENPKAMASTPIAAHRMKETSPSKRNSPYKESIVFNDDLEKELQWKDETTILFSQERIPIHKLFFQQAQPNSQTSKTANEVVQQTEDTLDSTVEYMDVSYNDTTLRDKTMTDIQVDGNKTEGTIGIESDSEFVDCETTFTKNESYVDNKGIADNITDFNLTMDVAKSEKNSNLKTIILNTTQDILDATLSITPEDLKTEILDNTKILSLKAPHNEMNRVEMSDKLNETKDLDVLVGTNEQCDQTFEITNQPMTLAKTEINNLDITKTIDHPTEEKTMEPNAMRLPDLDVVETIKGTQIENKLFRLDAQITPEIENLNVTHVVGTVGEELDNIMSNLDTTKIVNQSKLIENVACHQQSENLDVTHSFEPKDFEDKISLLDTTKTIKTTSIESVLQQGRNTIPQSENLDATHIIDNSVKDDKTSSLDATKTIDTTLYGNKQLINQAKNGNTESNSMDKKLQESQAVMNLAKNIYPTQNILIDNQNKNDVPVFDNYTDHQNNKIEDHSNPVLENNNLITEREFPIEHYEFSRTQDIADKTNADVARDVESNKEIDKSLNGISPENFRSISNDDLKQLPADIPLPDEDEIEKEPTMLNENTSESMMPCVSPPDDEKEILINSENLVIDGNTILSEVSQITVIEKIEKEEYINVNHNVELHSSKQENQSQDVELTLPNVTENFDKEVIPEYVASLDKYTDEVREKNTDEADCCKDLNKTQNTVESLNKIILIEAQQVPPVLDMPAPMDVNKSISEYKPLPDIVNQAIAICCDDNEQVVNTNELVKEDEFSVTEVNFDQKQMDANNYSLTEITQAIGANRPQEASEVCDKTEVLAAAKIVEEMTTGPNLIETVDINDVITMDNNKNCKEEKYTTLEIDNAPEKDRPETDKVENANPKVINEEIVDSENNSPFVSYVLSEHEAKAEDFKDLEIPLTSKTRVVVTPPASPPIASKGYNFNFDEMDNPFDTKINMRASPTSGTSNKEILPEYSERKIEKPIPKKINNNRRKSQPERKRPPAQKKKLNSTFNSPSDIVAIEKPLKVENVTSKNTDDFESNQPDVISSEDKEVQNIIQTAKQNIEFKLQEALKAENEIKAVHSPEIPIETTMPANSVTETKTSSSSEQSIYFSAGTSSNESIKSRNVFNLPEIDDMNFNPFATKSKMCQSPPLNQDTDNPFATRSKIMSSPKLSSDIPQNDANITINGNEPKISCDDKMETEPMEKDSSTNISDITTSSKATDERDATMKEVNTEDEDTVEGPFLEAEDEIKMNDLNTENDMINFELPAPKEPSPREESQEKDEMFIDAEAFQFLLNQNKSNIVVDCGKESLFLKFDPLFANRTTSDGVLATLAKLQTRQSTPTKLTRIVRPPPPKDAFSPVAGPSNTNIKRELDMSISEELNDDLNVTVSKPMMVVPPAVNPVTPRNKSMTPPRPNRRSVTFTSPAMAVIDRLLSLSANNSMQDAHYTQHASREQNEADLALSQLRELLAEKEVHVYNLRSESKELRDRLTTMESQVKSLEAESQDRLKKINDLNNRLADKTKINKSMAAVVEEYERTIASLISETEQDKKRHAEERMKLINERDEQTAHLTSMEVSFSDLHSKYEKSKQVILSCKANEDVYKKSIKAFEENLGKMQKNYELLKQHATSKLNHANQELEKMNKAHEAEVLKLNAMIKRKELHITSLEESLTQKTKANEELTAICDELINKVG